MKNIFKIIITLILAVGFLNAEPLSDLREKDGYKIKLYKNQNSEYSILIMEIPTPELSKISEKRKNTIHNLFSTYQNIIKTISVL